MNSTPVTINSFNTCRNELKIENNLENILKTTNSMIFQSPNRTKLKLNTFNQNNEELLKVQSTFSSPKKPSNLSPLIPENKNKKYYIKTNTPKEKSFRYDEINVLVLPNKKQIGNSFSKSNSLSPQKNTFKQKLFSPLSHHDNMGLSQDKDLININEIIRERKNLIFYY